MRNKPCIVDVILINFGIQRIFKNHHYTINNALIVNPAFFFIDKFYRADDMQSDRINFSASGNEISILL